MLFLLKNIGLAMSVQPIKVSPSTIVPQKDGYIDPSKHLQLIKTGNKCELNILSADGIAVGKSLLQFFEKGEDLSKLEEITINSSSSADLQFICNYLIAPPNGDFPKGFKGQKVTIRLLNYQAAMQLPTLITTTGNGRNKETKCSILPEEFQKIVKYEVIQTSQFNRDKLLKRINSAVEAIKVQVVLNDNDKVLLNDSLSKMEKYIKEKITFIESNDSAKTIRAKNRRTRVNPMLINELVQGKTIYASTDETTHFKLMGNTLVVVDSGNPATVNYVKALMKKHPGLVKDIKIYQTHFHHDHCARLADLIRYTRHNQIATTLNIHQKTMHQFAGYYTSNLPVFRNNSVLKIITSDSTAPAFSGQALNYLESAETEWLNHFIPNASISLIENNEGYFFSGDINPLPPTPGFTGNAAEEIQNNIKKYLLNIFIAASYKGLKKLNLFIDLGHFALNKSYLDCFNNEIARLVLSCGINARVYNEHNKSTDSFQLAVSK